MDVDCEAQEIRRKNVLGDKQTTNRLRLMFLDAKVAHRNVKILFLDSVKKNA